MIKAIQQDLPITMRMEKWLTENSNLNYSPEALEFAQEALSGTAGSQRRRKRMFRASSAGYCKRKQIFSILGMPQRREVDSGLSNIFATGNYLHLKWQMAGLTEGWLTQAEIPVDREDINAGGTMDGMTYVGTGFEFKTINSRGYQKVTNFGPLKHHLYQTHWYMFLADIEGFSIIYENKDTGDWREFKVDRDESLIDKAKEEIGYLNNALANKELPDMQYDCMNQTGTTYRNCPFRDICAKTQSWPV